jgi:hypothetical protein
MLSSLIIDCELRRRPKNDFVFHGIWRLTKPFSMSIKWLTVWQVSRPTRLSKNPWFENCS